MASPILVLLDIDGTLLDAQGEGKRTFFDALAEQFPGVVFPDVSMAGRTDHGLFLELTHAAGLSTGVVEYTQFSEIYARHLHPALEQRPPRLLPGVREFCQALRTEEFVTGIVTGNFYPGTFSKLSTAGLWDLFQYPFGMVGAYGDAVPHKGPLAIDSLHDWHRKTGLPRPRAIVIGDTSEDVRCARQADLPCLALATGAQSPQVLWESGADAVQADFSDLTLCLHLVRALAR